MAVFGVPLLIAELVALAPGDINDSDADGHRGKNEYQNSGTQSGDEVIATLGSLSDAESATLRARKGRQNQQGGKRPRSA